MFYKYLKHRKYFTFYGFIFIVFYKYACIKNFYVRQVVVQSVVTATTGTFTMRPALAIIGCECREYAEVVLPYRVSCAHLEREDYLGLAKHVTP